MDEYIAENFFSKLSTRSCKFSFSSRIKKATALKRTEIKLKLPTDINVLLIFEKGVRDGVCNSINRYKTVNNKYLKDYDKNKELSYLKYWDLYNSYGWATSQKLQ